MNEAITGTLLGVVVGFVLQELRQFISLKNDQKQKTKQARNIANMFLSHEISKNHKTLTDKHDNWTYLSAILEQIPTVVKGKGMYSISEWDKCKKDIARLDLDLANKINKVYSKYEILSETSGSVIQISKEMFADYEDLFNDVIKSISE